MSASAATPLLNQIEPDDAGESVPSGNIASAKLAPPKTPVVLTPGSRPDPSAASSSDAEAGIAGIFRQSAHPVSLFFLYFFRTAAIVVYLLCGFFTSNYVLSTVIVVVLLAMDFWNCRNVSGRTLVGLRYWNQVDEDGESYWVFESRDIALYTFPALWLALLIVSILKLSASFIPIVMLALVFNVSNAVGFTYADRDAKQKWANQLSSGWSIGGLGGQVLAGMVKNSVGKVFR
ncbi:uncharacterized protein PHACADRAFT_247259 [Phanerochaete carnosa HHB-10118-sp]|uniref:Golgi apparatus membrane protein TVP23 n=1 Tax=Phanerochaete carnosa (strain HHB-10118-sp) TaxID=650164 RepID=K5XD88_PHACS|nr:uncharacterized protein PHACADRAFT_247259 [Phanerochaete carnosa HHB-10118-sp]EKM60987.1 hypothetical protein PHACADRAFT_247259 [Phanerochaete carnosa HHB-10118-sp]